MTTDAQGLTVVTGAESDPARRRRKRLLGIGAHVLLITASILMLYPLLWLLSASFKPQDQIFTSGIWPTMDWSIDSYFRGWNGLRTSFSVFFNAIIQTIEAFKSFTPAFIISGGTGAPINSTLFYTLYLYNEAFSFFRMGYASALAWFLLLLIACFTAFSFLTSKYLVHYDD